MSSNYCRECGTKLVPRELENEGIVPYCPECEQYRFPQYNVAVSMIVTTQERDRILLIKQYGRDIYILVAGFVNKGEDAEDAVSREIMEELGLDVKSCSFNHSHYFEPSNTLMLNFTAVVDFEEPHPNKEIDDYKWFTTEEAGENIYQPSLASAFLKGYLHGKYEF